MPTGPERTQSGRVQDRVALTLAPDLGASGTLHDAYRDHQRAVHGLARRLCGSAAADDITQEVFLELWHRPDRFDPSKGTLRTFLLTVTHHRAVDQIRAQVARQRRENTATPTARSSGFVVEDEVESTHAAASVRDAVEALPCGERDAIVTAFYGQRTYRETAAVLGVPEGTAKTRIRSGMRRLSSALDDAHRPQRGSQHQRTP